VLTRLYIDNYKCFVNFEYRPARKQLILGGNGTGKSTLLEVLGVLRQFAVDGEKASSLFTWERKTRFGQPRPRLTFELEAALDGQIYLYRLVIERKGDPVKPSVVAESLHIDRRPLLEFKDNILILYEYDEHGEKKTEYPAFDTNLSPLASLGHGVAFHRFRTWFAELLCLRFNPFNSGAQADGEEEYPHFDRWNFPVWYRHRVEEYPQANLEMLASLRNCLDGFDSLRFEKDDDGDLLLVAEFIAEETPSAKVKFRFNELSEGQRSLVFLYAILHFVLSRGNTVILDEPDNFVSLREIQPWLTAVDDAIEDGHGQILIISHHPEIIDQWAPGSGVQFVREGIGAVRVEEFHGVPESPLSAAELIARGWERE
jgi:predicted ATPase